MRRRLEDKVDFQRLIPEDQDGEVSVSVAVYLALNKVAVALIDDAQLSGFGESACHEFERLVAAPGCVRVDGGQVYLINTLEIPDDVAAAAADPRVGR